MIISIVRWLVIIWITSCALIFLLLCVDSLVRRCTNGRRGISRRPSAMDFWGSFFAWAEMPFTIGILLVIGLLALLVDMPYAGFRKLLGKEPRGLLFNPPPEEDLRLLTEDNEV